MGVESKEEEGCPAGLRLTRHPAQMCESLLEALRAEALASMNGDKRCGRYSRGKHGFLKFCVNILGGAQEGAHVGLDRRQR